MTQEELLQIIKQAKEESWTKLSLIGQDLTELPKEIGQLTELQWLFLNVNQLKELPKEIGQLKKLRNINLNRNHLNELPKEIGQLSNLESLSLNDNQLKKLPNEIAQAKNLRTLYLNNNKLKELPKEMEQMTKLEFFDIKRNSFVIPIEIINSWMDAKKILNYFFQSLKGTPINEAKIVVVGEAGFGKSLLTHRLIHQTYKKTDPTHGIEISRWEKDVKVDGQDVSLNIWDFGGQEIMHSTHQFFFTKRTIYILVLNARENSETNNVEKWLSRIDSLGGDSPIIIVGNKVDENARGADSNLGYFEIPQKELKRKYPNIKGFYGVCSDARKTKFDGLFEEFRKALINEVSELKSIKELFPPKWFAIKDELEDMKEKGIPHISYNQYIQKCVKAEITEEINQETLVEFLHDLGIVICFDKKVFKDTMVFNPEWVTSGVYAIIDNDHIKEDLKGVFDKKLLNNILDKKDYPTDENRQYILDMMKEFELCIDIVKDKTFLVPDLLPVDENFTDDWENTLGFQYKYKSFLRSIITRFIVRNYQYVYEKEYWKNGIVLQHDGSKALIRASNSENRVYISIKGNNERKNRSFLEIIRREFTEIHKTFTNLGITEEVPHPKYPNIIRSYERLITMENNNIEEEFCEELGGSLPISDWLDGIETAETRRIRQERIKPYKDLFLESESANKIQKLKIIENGKIEKNLFEKEYIELNQEKDVLDAKAEVWTNIIRWGIGLGIIASLGYLIYWCVINIGWIEENWTKFEIGLGVFGILVIVAPLLWILFRSQKKSDETPVNWIEDKVKKRIYSKNDFIIADFNKLKTQITIEETELSKLKR